MENIQAVPAQKKRSRAPLIVTLCLLVALAGGYLGLCGYVYGSETLWRGTKVLGQDLGGLTVSQAAQKLDAALPGLQIGLYLYDGDLGAAPERGKTPDAVLSAADLGLTADTGALAQRAYDYLVLPNRFFSLGWRYLTYDGAAFFNGQSAAVDEARARGVAETAAAGLSWDAEDTVYETEGTALLVHMAKDGRTVDAGALAEGLAALSWEADLALDVPYGTKTARTMTAQAIHDEVSGEVKNAGYDAETGEITPERIGAEFDVDAAQALMDAAAPGETVELAADIREPAVTAEELAPVLFRDVLGTYTTHVGGSAARISNVKLAAAAINGTVLNSGDVFDYNGVVGQRTAARGYQAAPAYVKGETVDEIGGGVCQPSSTLYLATLKANLEIVERYAHRYVPAYIPKGMDATVSWGGPNYRFRNDTDYPIKVEAVYSKGYLTMSLIGTKTDDITVKMTNKVLSTTPAQVVYQDDPTLPAGTEQVKTSPYTGYKVETYRNLYDGNGKLISSTFEANSDYKVRNKLILKGPEKPAAPETPTTPVTPETPVVPGGQIITPEAPEGGTPETTPGGTQETPQGGGTAPPETPEGGTEDPGGTGEGGADGEAPEAQPGEENAG